MQINELLGKNISDESYDFKEINDDTYRFETDSNRIYDVIFSFFEGPHIVEVTFGLKVKDASYYNYGVASLNDMKETIKVFTTVINICKLYCEQKHPLVWVFAAKEQSRIKLYQRLSLTLAKTFNLKYKIETMYGEKMFILWDKTPDAQRLAQGYINRNLGWEPDV